MDIVRHPGEDLFFEAILSLRTVEDCRLFFEDVATPCVGQHIARARMTIFRFRHNTRNDAR